jgi:glucose-6-phosphate 1-epimerase
VTSPISTTTSPDGPVKITGKTDRVYTPAGGPTAPVTVSEGGKKKFTIIRDNLNEVVVWNPWTDAKIMGDFGPADGYKNMICVEAGTVKGWQKLEAGETWEGGQVIAV